MCIRDRRNTLVECWSNFSAENVKNSKTTIATMKRNTFLESLSLIHISEPTRLLSISYAVFCLKKKKKKYFFFFLMIRRPPRSTLDRSSAASDVYKRQLKNYNSYNEKEYIFGI